MSETDLDDAAFQARLAPLSLQVLPGGRGSLPPATPHEARPEPRRRGVVLAVIAAGTLLLLAVATYVMWLPFTLHQIARTPTRAAVPPTVPAPPDEMLRVLLQRGDAALAAGDITAARLLYERAAARGSAVAATDAGKTYDITYLLEIGARGIQADPSMATTWYGKAAALGDPEARQRLRRLQGNQTP